MNHKEDLIAGRNAVIEALRAKKPIDKIFVLDGCQEHGASHNRRTIVSARWWWLH